MHGMNNNVKVQGTSARSVVSETFKLLPESINWNSPYNKDSLLGRTKGWNECPV